MNLQRLIQFLADLINKKWTGQIRINFHEGSISAKIEKKESLLIE